MKLVWLRRQEIYSYLTMIYWDYQSGNAVDVWYAYNRLCVSIASNNCIANVPDLLSDLREEHGVTREEEGSVAYRNVNVTNFAKCNSDVFNISKMLPNSSEFGTRCMITCNSCSSIVGRVLLLFLQLQVIRQIKSKDQHYLIMCFSPLIKIILLVSYEVDAWKIKQ